MSPAESFQKDGGPLAVLRRHEKDLLPLADNDFDCRRGAGLSETIALMNPKLHKSLAPEEGWRFPVSRSGINRIRDPRIYFSDFHNHWGGILPVDRLIGIYRDHARGFTDWEGEHLRLAGALGLQGMRTEEWMFLRLSAAILHHKGKPKNRTQSPARGAHLLQYVMIYVWWWAYLNGLRDPAVDWTPTDYRDLWHSTWSVLDDLYVSLGQSQVETPLGRLFGLQALNKYLRATKTAPFDDSYVARSCLTKLIPSAEIDTQSIEYLVNEEKIGYLQVSQPPNKIDAAATRIRDYNANAAPSDRITVHWLALIASHREFMDNPRNHGYDDDAVGNDSSVAMAAINGDVGGGQVVGLDWAGPECQEFRLGPAISLVADTMDQLHKIANQGNRTVVFRPHVGEGSSLLEGGRSLIETEPGALVEMIRACVISAADYVLAHPFDLQTWGRLCGYHASREILRHPDDSFQTLVGRSYDEAVRRASNNLGTIIEAIMQYYQRTNGPSDKVKIRFGHATHATAEHARWMADLDIAADINLSSNLRTGSLSYMQNLDEGDVWEMLFGNWNWNPAPMATHSIRRLCNAGVTVVLGTDGQGVEVSTIPFEYRLASQLLPLNQFLQVIGPNTVAQRV